LFLFRVKLGGSEGVARGWGIYHHQHLRIIRQPRDALLLVRKLGAEDRVEDRGVFPISPFFVLAGCDLGDLGLCVLRLSVWFIEVGRKGREHLFLRHECSHCGVEEPCDGVGDGLEEVVEPWGVLQVPAYGGTEE